MNTNHYENLKKFLIVSAAVFVAIVIAYLFFTTVLRWFLPFVVAFGIAYATDPIVTFLEKKVKIPRKIASAVTILVTIFAAGSILTLIIYRVTYEVRRLSERIPMMYDKLYEQATDIFIRGMDIYVKLPLEVTQFIDNSMKELTGLLTSGLKLLTEFTTKSVYGLATSLPSILIFLIVLFISTYFISSDYERLKKFFFKQISPVWADRLISIKNDLLVALFGYIKAQLILMSITFVVVSIGMLVLGVDYALLLALIISFVDALPIVGSGSILMPWALFSLITGNYSMAISLVVLYGIAILIRQLMEPKVLGSQIGLYPLITLIAMYVGLQIFGVLGMILGPITVLIVVNLQKSGIIKLWKS